MSGMTEKDRNKLWTEMPPVSKKRSKPDETVTENKVKNAEPAESKKAKKPKEKKNDKKPLVSDKKSKPKKEKTLPENNKKDSLYIENTTDLNIAKPIDIQSKAIKNKAKAHSTDAPKRKKRKKTLASYTLYIILYAVIIIAALFILSKTILFNTEKIVVEGETVYSYDEVVEKCGVPLGTNLFSLNTSEVSDRLIKQLSYIDKAEVSWKFPTTLNIKLCQANAVANIQKGNVYYLISENGRIMNAELKAPEKKFVTVIGFDPEYAVSGDFLSNSDEGSRNYICKLLAAVKKYDGLIETGADSIYDKKEVLFSILYEIGKSKLADKIKEIDISNIYGIKLNYDNRIVLEIGECTEFALKLSIAENLINRGEFNGEKGTLILSQISSMSDSMKTTFRPDRTENSTSSDTTSSEASKPVDSVEENTGNEGENDTPDEEPDESYYEDEDSEDDYYGESSDEEEEPSEDEYSEEESGYEDDETNEGYDEDDEPDYEEDNDNGEDGYYEEDDENYYE